MLRKYGLDVVLSYLNAGSQIKFNTSSDGTVFKNVVTNTKRAATVVAIFRMQAGNVLRFGFL